jgi:hypothetical protein
MKHTYKLLLWVAIAGNVALFAFQMAHPANNQARSKSENAVVMRTPGGLLEVSTIASEERFDSSTTHTILGVPVGKTVAQIRVPAVYRYHIPLASEWTFRLAGNALVVIAPRIQASLPVAINTAKLESFASGIWSPLTGPEAIQALQQSITAHLATKAISPSLLSLQRESARKTVTEFIHKWVIEQTRWKEGKLPVILVLFEDEPLSESAQPLFATVP